MLVLFHFYFISIIFLKIYNTFFENQNIRRSDYIYNDKNNYKTNDADFEHYFCRLFMF